MSKILTDIMLKSAADKGIETTIVYDGAVPYLNDNVDHECEVTETGFEFKVYAESEESVAEKMKTFFDQFFHEAKTGWKVKRVLYRSVISRQEDEDDSDETYVSFSLVFDIEGETTAEYVDSRQIAVGESLRESFDRFIR